MTVLRPLSENSQMIREKEMKKACSFSPSLHTEFCPRSRPTTTLRPEAEKKEKKIKLNPQLLQKSSSTVKDRQDYAWPGHLPDVHVHVYVFDVWPLILCPSSNFWRKGWGGDARLCFTTHTLGRNTPVYSAVPAACSECRIGPPSVNDSCNHMWNYQTQTIIKINASVMPSLGV